MKQELNIEELVKLLMLTTSSNENEASSAMRKANALLAESNMMWTDLLGAEASKELLDLKLKHTQLINHFNELANKYRTLITQVGVVLHRPQVPRRTYRRNSRRF